MYIIYINNTALPRFSSSKKSNKAVFLFSPPSSKNFFRAKLLGFVSAPRGRSGGSQASFSQAFSTFSIRFLLQFSFSFLPKKIFTPFSSSFSTTRPRFKTFSTFSSSQNPKFFSQNPRKTYKYTYK